MARPVGAKNRLNQEMRQAISEFVSDNRGELLVRMSRLDDADWVRFYLQILRYTLPTLKSTSVSFENSSEGLNFTEVLSQLQWER